MDIVLTLLLLLVFTLFFYLTIVRPMNKRQRKSATMLNSLKPGDVVYTVDGIKGIVDAIKFDRVSVRCLPDDNFMTFYMESIKQIENYDEKAAKAKMKEKIDNSRRKKG
ncbi:MAG: preprotein translocase subunit YajC [Lachnospiraceae bacterium]|nr:preprotein translocase subunit YajC [Lachnospiraceae bacterium]